MKLDGQCAFNHSGILCGGLTCPGYFTVSAIYLLLLIPFALAGVGLHGVNIAEVQPHCFCGNYNGLTFHAMIIGSRHSTQLDKLKPLLDAYQGPHKEKFRYWTGLMLLLRIVLSIVFASNTLGDPRVNLLAITVALFGLFVSFWNAGRV